MYRDMSSSPRYTSDKLKGGPEMGWQKSASVKEKAVRELASETWGVGWKMRRCCSRTISWLRKMTPSMPPSREELLIRYKKQARRQVEVQRCWLAEDSRDETTIHVFDGKHCIRHLKEANARRRAQGQRSAGWGQLLPAPTNYISTSVTIPSAAHRRICTNSLRVKIPD